MSVRDEMVAAAMLSWATVATTPPEDFWKDDPRKRRSRGAPTRERTRLNRRERMIRGRKYKVRSSK